MQLPSLDVVKRAIGVELERTACRYNERDVALYALGIGAPADPLDQDELKFVYEQSSVGFQVFPTFAVVFSYEFNRRVPMGEIAGIKYHPMMVVHGEQFLRVNRPLPKAATVTSTIAISDIYDKGSGLLMIIDIRSCLDDGSELATARHSLFFRGLGGFGGERGPSSRWVWPEREPDFVFEESTDVAQALLYRLAGDDNPLHADPQWVVSGGYEKPILHGLCTMGFAARAIIKRCADNDPDRFKSIKVRFSRHVFPGETLVTEMWRESDHEIRFQTKVKERSLVVLSHGVMQLRG
ncbi:MAG: MaoC/PaaZ C-terminal domain-containing protein [Chloroflexi bacterium]|nr:MaoC/PaaZ C-terminal domain-containing protein [Chloroflexota bacterium]